MKNKNLLEVRFDDVNKKNISSYLDKFLSSKKFNMITPVNPEMLVSANKNPFFKQALNNSELVTPEASGIIFGFKLKFRKLQKYPGSSMVFDILNFAKKTTKKFSS